MTQRKESRTLRSESNSQSPTRKKNRDTDTTDHRHWASRSSSSELEEGNRGMAVIGCFRYGLSLLWSNISYKLRWWSKGMNVLSEDSWPPGSVLERSLGTCTRGCSGSLDSQRSRASDVSAFVYLPFLQLLLWSVCPTLCFFDSQLESDWYGAFVSWFRTSASAVAVMVITSSGLDRLYNRLIIQKVNMSCLLYIASNLSTQL